MDAGRCLSASFLGDMWSFCIARLEKNDLLRSLLAEVRPGQASRDRVIGKVPLVLSQVTSNSLTDEERYFDR